jgi:hypothetical protein
MVNMMSLFKVIIVVQLFYAFSITVLAYALPAESIQYTTAFSDVADRIDLEGVSSDLEESVGEQLNIPVIELGALIFYSGNIIIDLLLNFFFAIPEMISLFINMFLMLFGIDSYIFAIVELFATAVITVLYFVGLIQLLVSIRSGRGTLV